MKGNVQDILIVDHLTFTERKKKQKNICVCVCVCVWVCPP